MKGIILAGGMGSRLYPMTKMFTKQLQPVYDKPMIYYPLSFLMLGGIRDIAIITTPQDMPFFKQLLGDGSQLGIKLEYCIQEQPNGLPEAFVIAEKFIGGQDVTLVLGDNLFYGNMDFFRDGLEIQSKRKNGCSACVFAYSVSDPKAYGVVEFDHQGKVVSLEEKPVNPKSTYALPGLYIFDSTVVGRAKGLKKSSRGETEIVDLMKSYLQEEKLGVQVIRRGVAWLDTGTPENLLEASSFIGAIEKRQGLKIACLEEVALRMGYIDEIEYGSLIESIPSSPYKAYLQKLIPMIRNEKT
jgi:glucose-1-phosphate thymidylyltransferase